METTSEFLSGFWAELTGLCQPVEDRFLFFSHMDEKKKTRIIFFGNGNFDDVSTNWLVANWLMMITEMVLLVMKVMPMMTMMPTMPMMPTGGLGSSEDRDELQRS